MLTAEFQDIFRTSADLSSTRTFWYYRLKVQQSRASKIKLPTSWFVVIAFDLYSRCSELHLHALMLFNNTEIFENLKTKQDSWDLMCVVCAVVFLTHTGFWFGIDNILRSYLLICLFGNTFVVVENWFRFSNFLDSNTGCLIVLPSLFKQLKLIEKFLDGQSDVYLDNKIIYI